MEILPADFAGWRMKECLTLFAAERRSNFFGRLFAEPKEISRASLKELCLFVRGTVLLNVC
jgi:hypothetical protein